MSSRHLYRDIRWFPDLSWSPLALTCLWWSPLVSSSFGFITALDYIYRRIWAQIHKHFTASVTVESYDDIFDHIVSWVSDHHVSSVTRSLRVRSGRCSTWNAEVHLAPDARAVGGGLRSGSLFNFSNWEAKIPPRFDLDEISKWFWHKGHLRFKRDIGRWVIWTKVSG